MEGSANPTGQTAQTVQNPISRIARERFGVEYLYPIQHFVISNILDGISQIVVLPTGGGKSLCFQLPSGLLSGLTLVVVPLLSLMGDQRRRLEERNIPAGILRGGQSREERRALYRKAAAGQVKIILVTPEVLIQLPRDPLFNTLSISHLVVDEAHCVSEWGKSFRPSYGRIKDFVLGSSVAVITAFTATASSQVLEGIRSVVFPDRPVRLVQDNPDRPNIFYRVIPALSKSKTLVDLLISRPGNCVVFCATRSLAEITARLIRRRVPGRETYFYHAGLSREERQIIEGWFFDSKNGILTATSAYGMGVDKADIRTAIHTGIPPSVEAYLQESGRIGRDGSRSEAILLHGRGETPVFMAGTDPVSSEVSRQRWEQMRQYAVDARMCRRNRLLTFIDQDEFDCSGCDVCMGQSLDRPPEEAGLRRLLKKHRRRFSRRELAALLRGLHSYEVIQKSLYLYNGFGALKGWYPGDIEEALDALYLDEKPGLLDRWF